MNNTKVNELLDKMNHPLRTEIDTLREIISNADAEIKESVKWNAPSFYTTEHFATFKLRPADTIQIIFHTDAKVRKDIAEIKIDDPSGLLKWAAKARAVMTFSDKEDVDLKKDALTDIVKQWMKYV